MLPQDKPLSNEDKARAIVKPGQVWQDNDAANLDPFVQVGTIGLEKQKARVVAWRYADAECTRTSIGIGRIKTYIDLAALPLRHTLVKDVK